MQMQTVLYSVVITAYNYGRYLRRAIDSAIAQDFDRYEIIVVDDGSDDDTQTIAAHYGDRVRYVRQEHSGPFVAARTGVRLARGNYVLFVDADDRLRPSALRNLHEVAAANPQAAIVLGKICSIDEDKGTTVYEEGAKLSNDATDNFARFCRGNLKAPIAGGLIQVSLLSKFDRDGFEYPSSMDLAILGLGLTTRCVQADHCTLDVFAHADRLRDDINYIHRSGLRLVDVLFDKSVLPSDCFKHRQAFLAFIEQERARSYYRAGWHSLSWRSYARAIAAAPATVFGARGLRRFLTSLLYSVRRKPEGPVASPRSHWLFGHQREFYADPIVFTRETVARFATNIALKLQKRTYLLVAEPDVDQVLRRNTYNYQPGGISQILPAFFAGAVLGTPHPRHETVRRWLARFFRTKDIAEWVPAVCEIVGRRTATDFPAGSPFDLAPVMRSINFEIASRIVLGKIPLEVMNRLDHLLLKSHSYCSRILRSYWRLPRWVPIRSNRVVRTVEREIDMIFDSLFSRGGESEPRSILELMLAERSRGEGNQGEEGSLTYLRHTTAGLMLAACEPVAITTTVALHMLGKHPALENCIADEVARVKRQLGAAPLNYSTVREFVLLNRFIDEVHRLYPAEWLLTRTAMHTERLPSGLLIRRGDQVMIDLNRLHRDPAIFSDPDRCNPDRFEQAAIKSSSSYLPFGAGATACLGPSLARLIIVATLATILARWRIEALEDDVRLNSLNCFSIAVDGPVPVRLHERGTASRGSDDVPGHPAASCPYAAGPPPAQA
jgi:cytochrome P450/glycosyltransferase involved in cell wall biosynthesis